MPRFVDALNRDASSIKRPPPAPIGFYKAFVSAMPGEPRSVSDGAYDVLTIPCKLLEPLDNVDPDALAAFGEVKGTPIRVEFMFPTADEEVAKYEGALNRLKTFATHCGIDTEVGTPKEWIGAMVNSIFICEIGHRADPNDAANFYTEVKRTMINE